MIKRLRRKFIASNMFLVTIIILFVFCALFVTNYTHERNSSLEVLSSVANNKTFNNQVMQHGQVENVNFAEYSEINSKLSTVILAVQTDKSGKLVSYATSNNVNATKEAVNKVAQIATNSPASNGVISKFNVRFLKVNNEIGGYNIAYADITSENATLSFLMRVYILGAVFILSIMFLISDYMAYKAIAPVEKSWKNQNRFVADASHELKTPLTVILANMDIISANPGATVEEEQKWIDNTKSEAKRMTQLVNDMLFLAKSDAAVEQSLNPMEVNFSNLCEECALTFESVAFERGVTLTSSIEPDVYTTVDEAKMKQAIMVLLDNAIKYVNDHGVITITMISTSKNIKLSVLNTGEPIPVDKQNHIFERFFRADESRVREKGGYGLGLSIAANIMNIHKGKLALDFSDEHGTCFTLTLPASKQTGSIIRKIPHIENKKEKGEIKTS